MFYQEFTVVMHNKNFIRCASTNKYQIIWENNWENSSDCEKASNLWHKFDAFSQSELIRLLFPQIISYLGGIFVKILL